MKVKFPAKEAKEILKLINSNEDRCDTVLSALKDSFESATYYGYFYSNSMLQSLRLRLYGHFPRKEAL